MTWLYNENPLDEDDISEYIGFVYLITNLTNDKKYIGKKLLKKSKTKQIKGKKKKFLVESDWKTYFGSNKILNEDVLSLGEHNFRREVIVLCKSKGLCNYHEARLQFTEKVLERDDYYNEWIMVKVHRSHCNIKEKSNALASKKSPTKRAA
jgi:hypothetical protein